MAELEEALESLISCPICMEDYTDPRILPCRHSFCEICLNGHIHDSARENRHTGVKTFRCPICRCKSRDKTDEHGDSGFPQSLAIIEILKSKETIINEEGNFSDTTEDIDQTGLEKNPETPSVKRISRNKRRHRTTNSSRNKKELRKPTNNALDKGKKEQQPIVEADNYDKVDSYFDYISWLYSFGDEFITNAIISFFADNADHNIKPNACKFILFVTFLMLACVCFFYPYSTSLLSVVYILLSYRHARYLLTRSIHTVDKNASVSKFIVLTFLIMKIAHLSLFLLPFLSIVIIRICRYYIQHGFVVSIYRADIVEFIHSDLICSLVTFPLACLESCCFTLVSIILSL